jgi:hypothetical protein
MLCSVLMDFESMLLVMTTSMSPGMCTLGTRILNRRPSGRPTATILCLDLISRVGIPMTMYVPKPETLLTSSHSATRTNTAAQVYSFARSLSGPWSSWKEFADDGSNTYHSQSTFILPLNATTAIYMGDRWYPNNLMRSTYIWLPLELTGQTDIWLRNRVNWIPELDRKSWRTAPAERVYEGEAATLSNGARSVSCSGCSGSSAAGYIGGDGDGSLQVTVTSDAATKTTLRLGHANGNSVERYASVSVNGVSREIPFLPTNDGQTPSSSTLNVDLRAGSNTIVIRRSTKGGYASDIDAIRVPVN